jgi:hypothetical protein
MSVKHNITAITLCTTFMLLLAGCQSRIKTLPSTPSSSVQNERQAAENENTQLQQCRDELDALKSIEATQYGINKAEFDRLMGGAAKYAAVRNKVNNGTQDTVDALYRYKVNRLCAEIKQSLMKSLSDRAESIK